MTVVLSIHQPRPDVLRLMDRALILSGFGEVVYSGERRRLSSNCRVWVRRVLSFRWKGWVRPCPARSAPGLFIRSSTCRTYSVVTGLDRPQ